MGADQDARDLHEARPALWISGYFAGLNHAARRPGADETYEPLPLVNEPVSRAASQRTLTILHGSETGNSAGLARILRGSANSKDIGASLVDMADYRTRKLKDKQDLIIVTSTHGEGEPPFSGMSFFEFIEGRKAPKLPDLGYAVLALGDSTYEFFCEAGKRLDRRLAELGATRLQDRVDCDVDYDVPAAAWTAALFEARWAPGPASPASRARPSTPI